MRHDNGMAVLEQMRLAIFIVEIRPLNGALNAGAARAPR